MRKYILLAVVAVLSAASAGAQKLAVKNNVLADAALMPNLAVEFRMAPKWTLDTYLSWNPFFKSDRGIGVHWDERDAASLVSLKHFMGQPEVRFWTCEAFNGFFIGAHVMAGIHSISGIEWPPITIDGSENSVLQKDKLYEGWFYGSGISVGHQWLLGGRWNIEASIGGGYINMIHDEFLPADPCNATATGKSFPFIWVSKATLSIVFIIK